MLPIDHAARGGIRVRLLALAMGVAVTVAVNALQAQEPTPGPTFTKDVAPIFYKHCVSCHRPGDVAPMSLLTYGDTLPWARSIQRRVTERTMPPWFADPHYGAFQNDRRLTDAEIQTIVRWISTGVRQGNPADLPAAPFFPDGWRIGTPDAVYQMPVVHDIPATGPVDLQFFQVRTGFAEDKWIQAVEVRPGNRAHVHHVIMYYQEPEPGTTTPVPAVPASTTPPSMLGSSLTVFASGTDPLVYPAGTARRMRAGSVLLFEVHYVTNGTAATDRTQVALRFAPEPPRVEVRAFSMANSKFVIPPGAPDHTVVAKGAFDQPLTIWSIMPHMHLRGKSFEYRLVHPDGRIETILSVPRYDPNWQVNYTFEKPVVIPPGTFFEATARYDNSPTNRSNPDPSKEVRWGWDPSQEMMFSYVTYSMGEPR